jgi:hypothetical protein
MVSLLSLSASIGLGRCDLFAYSRQRSSTVENEVSVLNSNSELLPQVIQIDGLRTLSHVFCTVWSAQKFRSHDLPRQVLS